MLGGADARAYRRAVETLLADPECDGVLAVMTPQALIDSAAVVEGVAAAAAGQEKPILASLVGQASLGAAFAAAHRLRIPAYTFPEDATAAFGVLCRRGEWLAGAARRSQPAAHDAVAAAKARRAVQDAILIARGAGRTALDAVESRSLLAAYGVPTPEEHLATSPADAATWAAKIGYPVALKLISPDILHKTDVGGVLLNVTSAEGVRAGFEQIVTRAAAAHPGARLRGVQVQQMIHGGQEVIVGVKRDPTFGPLVMFGLGGVYVEALADVSFRLAPLTLADAEELIGEVRSAKLLTGLRGAAPADRAALAETIVRIGRLAADHPEIVEMDVNPLLVLPEGQGAVAVDARIILGSDS
jgi:acetyltransferase